MRQKIRQRIYWKVYLKKLVDKSKSHWSFFKQYKNLASMLEMRTNTYFK